MNIRGKKRKLNKVKVNKLFFYGSFNSFYLFIFLYKDYII